jgi:hypothetical protein
MFNALNNEDICKKEITQLTSESMFLVILHEDKNIKANYSSKNNLWIWVRDPMLWNMHSPQDKSVLEYVCNSYELAEHNLSPKTECANG